MLFYVAYIIEVFFVCFLPVMEVLIQSPLSVLALRSE